MKSINTPIEILTKLAEYLDKSSAVFPQLIEELNAEPEAPEKSASDNTSTEPSPELVKTAQDLTAELISVAGLQADKAAGMRATLAQHDGSLKVVGKLITKIASMKAEIENQKQLALGRPKVGSDESTNSLKSSNQAWVDALLH